MLRTQDTSAGPPSSCTSAAKNKKKKSLSPSLKPAPSDTTVKSSEKIPDKKEEVVAGGGVDDPLDFDAQNELEIRLYEENCAKAILSLSRKQPHFFKNKYKKYEESLKKPVETVEKTDFKEGLIDLSQITVEKVLLFAIFSCFFILIWLLFDFSAVQVVILT